MQDVEDDQELVEAEGSEASLAGRIAARAKELELQQTERFAIPGYEGVMEVELKAIGLRTLSAIHERNKRTRDPATQQLNNAADQLLRATVAFWEVQPDGVYKELDGFDWVRAAELVPGAPRNMTPRQALLYFVGEKRILFLIDEWVDWARSVRSDVDAEVRADFAGTG